MLDIKKLYFITYGLVMFMIVTGCSKGDLKEFDINNQQDLPDGFVYLKDVNPNIRQDIKYATHDNFIGRRLPGYEAASCILTKSAAIALSRVQKEISRLGMSLLVYDCYRPQKTVEYFIHWSEDIADQKYKAEYYPRVDKKDLFELGYISNESNHSRGSTVDVTIMDAKTGRPLDMGTRFDFMDPLSHPYSNRVTKAQYHNRQFLRRIMKKHGFKGILTEWWHFTLMDEPYKDQAFNFPVIGTTASATTTRFGKSIIHV